MSFSCEMCSSRRTLPTLQWETVDDPQISLVECLMCGYKWKPPRIKRSFDTKVLSRKDEKQIDRTLYHGNK